MNDVLISADAHLGEPADLYAERLPRNLRDRAVRAEFPGRYMKLFEAGSGAPMGTATRFQHADGSYVKDIGGGSAEQLVADLEADGVWGATLYPNGVLFGAWVPDHELAIAHARVYNDFVAESYAPYQGRLLPMATIPLTDVDDAVEEIDRAAGLGLRGIMLPAMPPQPYDAPDYDRIWAAAQSTGMHVTMHVATGFETDDLGNPMSRESVSMASMARGSADSQASRLREKERGAIHPKDAIMSLVGSGVLERYPQLHFVFVEFGAYWLVSLMAAMDKQCRVGIGQDTEWEVGTYDDSRSPDDQQKLVKAFDLNRKWPYPLSPSDYVRRQVHVTFMDDPVAIACRHVTGVEPLLWGNDYAHAEGTYPRSRESIDEQFAGVDPAERQAMLGGTLANLFGLEPPRSVAVA